MSTVLPLGLFSAFEWTAAAGELEQLRALRGGELATYARQSGENYAEHVDAPVYAQSMWTDILLLNTWLCDLTDAQFSDVLRRSR